jgi:Membrane protein involved in the export of O-antigen and teichoic acid
MVQGSTSGPSRLKNYLLQVQASFCFKVLAVAATFLYMPLNIHYLGQEIFGVWSTILTVLSWFTFFDLGLGNGLRNKVTECLAKRRPDEARAYISSAYSIIGAIAAVLLVLIAVLSATLNWQRIFNTHSVSEGDLRLAVLIAGASIALNFVLSLVTSVLNGAQKTSLVVFGQFATNFLFLVVVFVLNLTAEASLPLLALGYGVALVATNAGLNLWFFHSWRRATGMNLRPQPSIDKAHAKPLLNLGAQFFIIQIAVLVLFTTDKMLITQFFGPSYVTQYDVVFKYFSVITILYGLITSPLWNAYGDAYHRGDFGWIRKMLKTQFAGFGLTILAVAVMVLAAKPVIALWVGRSVPVSFDLVVAMAAFVAVSTFNNMFGCVLGGINKIRLSSIYTAMIAVTNIPACYLFAKVLGFGVPGVLLGTISSMMVAFFVTPVQVYYFIYAQRKSPFWSRVLR